MRFVSVLLLVKALLSLNPAVAQSPKNLPGLTVTFTGENQTSDITTVPNVWLYVPAGQSVTPFLNPGKVNAVWEGFVSADLRGDFIFRAELSGSLKLELNGAVALEVAGEGKVPSAASKPIRLNKGPNSIRATFTGPPAGDAMLRLQWSEKGVLWEPIPVALLAHAPGNSGLAHGDMVRQGRDLFFEHRCARCHVVASAEKGAPELGMDAPDFEGIGGRRGSSWMAAWILDPKSMRPLAHMPKLLNGAAAKEDAEAIAAFLASQKGDSKNSPAPSADLAGDGKILAEKLHCIGCHNLPDSGESDPKKITLKHVNAKFPAGNLAAFIEKPDAHYAWTRMPHFKLTNGEPQQLAAYLSSVADKAGDATTTADAAIIDRGKNLVQTSGCLNCHQMKLENRYPAKQLADIKTDKLESGCLVAVASADSKAPQYGFAASDRAALLEFMASDRSSLIRHVPVEFAERQSRNLNCTACHGQIDGFPTFDKLGGKLKPEWMKQFLAGEVPYKPRHWVEARMPEFVKRAGWLAEGLAMSHGFPPQTPAEPPIDMELAKIGQKLVGTDGGFSCVSCHSVGPAAATQVFESEGINLAYPASRLQKSYFQRWVQDPLRVDATTKMPRYFDEDGKSPFTDVLDGSAANQIEALWQYLRQGEKIPAPGAP